MKRLMNGPQWYDSQVIDEAFPNDIAAEPLLETPTYLNYFVEKIEWERVNISFKMALSPLPNGMREAADLINDDKFDHIREKLNDLDEFSGVLFVLGKTVVPIAAIPEIDGSIQFTISVTTFMGRKRIPTGTLKIVPIVDGIAHPFASIAMSRVAALEDSSRVFQYDGNKSAYTITFGITEDDHRPEFLLRSYQYALPNGKPKRKNPFLRIKRSFKRKFNKDAQRRWLNRFYKLSRKINPPTGSRLLFTSEARSELGGNLLAVHDRLAERGISFELRQSFTIPSTQTKKSLLRTIYLIATSDVIVLDDYYSMLGWLKISKDTIIIQAWHAGSGFKNVGYSRFGKYGSPKLESPHRKYTYSIAGSTLLTHTYAEAFGIENSAVIPTGLPRIDSFLDTEKIDTFKKDFYIEYPELQGKKLVLFAPTFRGRGITTAYYDYSQLDFDRLYDYCGDDTIFIFRMHHFIKEEVPIPEEYRDRMKNFTHFNDGLNLMHVIDVMITDYSSIIYEYSMLDRPMLFFSYDREVYEATRGFHRDYKESAPGKVCDSFQELIQALETEDYEAERIQQFKKENFDNIDQHSSDRFIDWLLLKHLKPLSDTPQLETSVN